jgi:hypothetical protein
MAMQPMRAKRRYIFFNKDPYEFTVKNAAVLNKLLAQ